MDRVGGDRWSVNDFRFRWQLAVRDAPADVLNATEKLIALTLSLHMDVTGGNCYPSMAKLASETSLNDSTIKRALRPGRNLRRWLKIRPGKGRTHSNHYQAVIPKMAHTAPFLLERGAQGSGNGALSPGKGRTERHEDYKRMSIGTDSEEEQGEPIGIEEMSRRAGLLRKQLQKPQQGASA